MTKGKGSISPGDKVNTNFLPGVNLAIVVASLSIEYAYPPSIYASTTYILCILKSLIGGYKGQSIYQVGLLSLT